MNAKTSPGPCCVSKRRFLDDKYHGSQAEQSLLLVADVRLRVRARSLLGSACGLAQHQKYSEPLQPFQLGRQNTENVSVETKFEGNLSVPGAREGS